MSLTGTFLGSSATSNEVSAEVHFHLIELKSCREKVQVFMDLFLWIFFFFHLSFELRKCLLSYFRYLFFKLIARQQQFHSYFQFTGTKRYDSPMGSGNPLLCCSRSLLSSGPHKRGEKHFLLLCHCGCATQLHILVCQTTSLGS